MVLNSRFFQMLTENELFSGLKQEQLSAVLTAQQVTFVRFSRGQSMNDAAPDGPAIGFVLRGEIRVLAKHGGQRLETLRPGDVFGCEALFLGEQGQIGSAVAVKPGEAAFLSRSAVAQLMERDPLFSLRFIRCLSQRVVQFSSRIGQYSAGSAQARLAQLLLAGFGDYKTYELDQSMSQLAVQLQIGRASLYRAFDALEAGGAVRRDGKNIRLVDRDILASFAKTDA